MAAVASTLDITRPTPHVARIFLNRPQRRNAFDADVVAELTQTFVAFSQDEALRVVVLGGHGPAFCAGADLAWMRAMAGYSWDENHADALALASMLWAIDQCPVPVVGRVQGDCYAGGMGLAAVCDVLIAADDAHFCLSEARLGLLPATIGPYVIRAIGARAARRYFVTAERFGARQALTLGLAHTVCEPAALDGHVEAVVAMLVANAPHAVRACKALVHDVAGRPITAELRADTARRIADVRASDEGREGVQAFLQKRKPGWLPKD